MIYSMTGYGKATVELNNKKLTIEIKSLNSKQFDLFTRIPIMYREKEIGLRNELSKKLIRGKIDLIFNIEYVSKDSTTKIDHNLLKSYYEELSLVAEQLKVEQPIDWMNTLLRMPEVMKQEVEVLDEKEWMIIEKTILEATEALLAFREQEGNMLEKLLRDKIENILQLLSQIDEYEDERIEKIKSRISESLLQIENTQYDANRFEQEMIYYLEKLDINEEKTRLSNHLKYFIETIEKESMQGKKLGFISQEIGREINTLGSKSNHFEIQRIVVQMKDELEQIKEQLLNIL